MNSKDLEAAIEARREYQRNWRKTHPENVRRNQMVYWAHVAERARIKEVKGDEGRD